MGRSTRDNPYRQAIDAILNLVVKQGFTRDWSMSVSCRRFDNASTIEIVHPVGIVHLVVTDDDIDQALTPRYRFNRKDATDFDRFKMAASQIVGKRLTWKQVIGMQDGAAWAN